mgnify:CR=1 FL=1
MVEQIISLWTFVLYIIQQIQALERIISKKHIVKDHSYRPNVNALIVRFLCENLWSHEVWSTTLRFSSLTEFFGETKIAYFADVVISFWYFFEKNVFAFEVSVYDIFLMYGFESSEYLNEDVACFWVFEYFLREGKLIRIEISKFAVLHN